MAVCKQCGKVLISDEIAIYRKLVSRNATEFLCRKDLSVYFGVTEEKIQEKIEQFRRQGCMLFSTEPQHSQEDLPC